MQVIPFGFSTKICPGGQDASCGSNRIGSWWNESSSKPWSKLNRLGSASACDLRQSRPKSNTLFNCLVPMTGWNDTAWLSSNAFYTEKCLLKGYFFILLPCCWNIQWLRPAPLKEEDVVPNKLKCVLLSIASHRVHKRYCWNSFSTQYSLIDPVFWNFCHAV